VAHAGQQTVGERDQGDEGEHHCAHRDGEADTGLGALSGGHDDVGRPFAFLEGLGDLDLLLDRFGLAVERQLLLTLRLVGHHDLGHENAAGRRHEGGSEQVGQRLLAEHGGVSGEDGALRRPPCRRSSR
jgi:hypothetical protein